MSHERLVVHVAKNLSETVQDLLARVLTELKAASQGTAAAPAMQIEGPLPVEEWRPAPGCGSKQNLLKIFLASAGAILPNADLPGFNTQHNYRCGRVSGEELTKQQRADILAFRKQRDAWSLRSRRRQILRSAHSPLLLRLMLFIGSMPRCSGPITTPL